MKIARTLTAVLGLALAVAALVAAPALGAGKAGHHKRHHPPLAGKSHVAPATGASAALAAPPANPAISAAKTSLRGGLSLPTGVGGKAVAMQTGTWSQGDDDPDGTCQTLVDNANYWQEKGDYLAGKGDQAGANQAYDNASTQAGEGNAAGCTIFLIDD